MIYRHSFLLTKVMAFLLGFFKIRQLSPIHPTCAGCVVLFTDEENGVVYRLSMDVVHSEVIIENANKLPDNLMLGDILKEWKE